jgi:hypothetical protein
MLDDEASIARVRAKQSDPALKVGAPLVAGPVAAIVGFVLLDRATTDGAFLVGFQLVPFAVLAFVAFALNRWVVLATALFLVVATVSTQYAVANSTSSTAAVALVVFPVELCAVPILVLCVSWIVAAARGLLRRVR